MALKIERESKLQDQHINFGGSLRDPANASLSSVPSGSLQPPPLPRDWVGDEERSHMLAPDAPLPPQSTDPAQVRQPPPLDSTQVRQPPSLPPRLTSVPPPDVPLTPHVADLLQIRLPPPLPLGLSTTSSLDPEIVRVPQSSERLTDHVTDRSGRYSAFVQEIHDVFELLSTSMDAAKRATIHNISSGMITDGWKTHVTLLSDTMAQRFFVEASLREETHPGTIDRVLELLRYRYSNLQSLGDLLPTTVHFVTDKRFTDTFFHYVPDWNSLETATIGSLTTLLRRVPRQRGHKDREYKEVESSSSSRSKSDEINKRPLDTPFDQTRPLQHDRRVVIRHGRHEPIPPDLVKDRSQDKSIDSPSENGEANLRKHHHNDVTSARPNGKEPPNVVSNVGSRDVSKYLTREVSGASLLELVDTIRTKCPTARVFEDITGDHSDSRKNLTIGKEDPYNTIVMIVIANPRLPIPKNQTRPPQNPTKHGYGLVCFDIKGQRFAAIHTENNPYDSCRQKFMTPLTRGTVPGNFFQFNDVTPNWCRKRQLDINQTSSDVVSFASWFCSGEPTIKQQKFNRLVEAQQKLWKEQRSKPPQTPDNGLDQGLSSVLESLDVANISDEQE